MDRHLKIHMEELKGPQASVLNCQSKHVKGHVWETDKKAKFQVRVDGSDNVGRTVSFWAQLCPLNQETCLPRGPHKGLGLAKSPPSPLSIGPLFSDSPEGTSMVSQRAPLPSGFQLDLAHGRSQDGGELSPGVYTPRSLPVRS